MATQKQRASTRTPNAPSLFNQLVSVVILLALAAPIQLIANAQSPRELPPKFRLLELLLLDEFGRDQLAECKTLIVSHPEIINTPLPGYDGDWAPIIWSILRHRTTLTQLLLDNGAKIDDEELYEDGGTPLAFAALIGNSELVSLLLDRGAKANPANALSLAARRGDVQMCEALLDKGADPNTLHGEYSPISEALLNGHTELAAQLVARGAKISDVHLAAGLGDMSFLREAVSHKPAAELTQLLNDEGVYNTPPLSFAVANGQFGAAKFLILHGALVNEDDTGSAALCIAAMFGDERMCRFLMEKGAIVNFSGDDEPYALHFAAMSGANSARVLAGLASGGLLGLADKTDDSSAHRYIRTVKLLLRKGANKNATADGLSASALAYMFGRNSTFPILSPSGVDSSLTDQFLSIPDSVIFWLFSERFSDEQNALKPAAVCAAKGEDGGTALHVLADGMGMFTKYSYCVLSQMGVDVCPQDDAGDTPLHIAAEEGSLADVIGLTLAGAKIEIKNSEGKTPLFLAAQNGEISTVEYLIAKGADVNTRSIDGTGCLYAALVGDDKADTVRESASDMAKLFVGAGADVNVTGPKGEALWERVIQGGSFETAMLLFEHGAPIDQLSSNGNLPLSVAVGNGKQDIAEWLLDFGAPLEGRNSAGQTALHLAACCGKKEIAELLLARGANVNATSPDGTAPLYLAVGNGNQALVEVLLEHGAKVELLINGKKSPSPLLAAAQRGDRDLLALLLSRGGNIRARDKFGRTALHFAVEKGDAGIVAMLLDRGAEVNARDALGVTPLHLVKNNDDVLKMLLAHGAR